MDLQQPHLADAPLVGSVPRPEGVPGTPERDRDEAILGFLRQRLWERAHAGKRDAVKASSGEEDKYEPQRLGRKILWQYDSSAKRVPLLRRHYI